MELLKVDQLSKLMNIKTQTIYDWVHKGQIPYVKVGRLVRFDINDIERWLKTKKHNSFNRH